MARLNLKNILSKKNETSAFVFSFIEQISAFVYIEDENGNLLFNNAGTTTNYQHPVKLDDETVGWVKGDEKTAIIAGLLTILIQKESERKKLGNEVLNLYQEVNFIFNFSEKLAQTIDPDAIAKMALKEASHLIRSTNGAVVLWNEKSKQFQVIASSGELFLQEEKINSNIGLLLKIALSGQSEIIDDISTLTEAGIISPNIKSLIFSALKVKHRIMGAIILARHEAIQYAAADLKLLKIGRASCRERV